MNSTPGVHIATLLSGKVAAHMLLLITTPVITRLFLPTHFGILQIFESIAAMFFSLSCMDYDLSIPLGTTREERHASVLLSLFSTLLVCGGASLFVLSARHMLAARYHMPELAWWLLLLPAVVLLEGLYYIVSAWAANENDFGMIALAGLGNIVGERAVMIGWGRVAQPALNGLLFGRVSGALAQVFILLCSSGRKLLADLRTACPAVAVIRAVAIRHKKFPLFNSWSGLLTILSIQLPPLVFGLSFSQDVIGHYALASRVAALPIMLLGGSIAQVFYPAAAKLHARGDAIGLLVQDSVHGLVMLSVFPLSVLGFLGPELFSLFFGPQWTEAGVYTQIRAGLIFLVLVNEAFDIFALTNRQELNLYCTLAGFPVRLGSLLLGVRTGHPRLAIGIYVCGNALFSGSILWYKLRLSQVSTVWALQILLKHLVLSCVLLGPVKYLAVTQQMTISTIGSLCLAAAAYGAFLLRTEPRLTALVKTARQKFF